MMIKWYKRDPLAALEGMAELSLEERGAYNTVLDLIYTRDGSIDDDDRFLAGWLRVDVRVWRRIRARLLDLGKLYVIGGKLRNARADREVDAALHRVRSAAQAGLASAGSRAIDRRISNDLAPTVVERTLQLSTPTSRVVTTSSILSRARETQDVAQQGQPTKRPSDVTRHELETDFVEKRRRRAPSTGADRG